MKLSQIVIGLVLIIFSNGVSPEKLMHPVRVVEHLGKYLDIFHIEMTTDREAAYFTKSCFRS